MDSAIADFSKAIKNDPKYASIYYGCRGVARADKGDLNDAIADFTRAIELGPRYASAYIDRGIAKAARRDLDGAIADFDQAIKIDPDDAQIYYSRGVAKAGKNEWQAAIEDYSKAVELDPEFALAYNNRGIAKAGNGDSKGAMADYRKALEIDSQLASAYYNLFAAREKQEAKTRMMLYSANIISLYIHVIKNVKDKKHRDRFLGICKDISDLLLQTGASTCANNGDDKAVMHYASLDVLVALARGERYRLYDAAGMTDSSEGTAMFDFLGAYKEKALKMMDEQIDNKAFIGSFVTDSNAVSGDEMMWQTYGKQSSGCALVFENTEFARFQGGVSDYLEELIDDLCIPHQECHLCKVIYPTDRNKDKLKKIIGKIHANFRQYPDVSRWFLDFMRFFFKAKRYERESEARIVVWRDKSTASDVSGKFPRAYVECYVGFKPKRILLGPKVEKPELWKEWLGQQPGTEDIGVKIVV